MDAAQLYKPEHQNNAQRKGFALALIAMVVLIFLHNPLDGYRISETKTSYKDVVRSNCTQKDADEAQRLQIQSTWPINNWNFWAEGYLDPLPKGIESWPRIKQLEWQNTFGQRAQSIRSRCIEMQSRSYEEALPFTEWTSNGPLVNWLGSVVHLLGAIAAVATAALVWLFVLGAPSNVSSEP